MFVLSWSLPQVSLAAGLKPLQRAPVFCIERKHLHWNLLCWNIASIVTSLRVSRCCLFPAATSPHPFLFSTHTSQPRPSLKIPHSHISCYSFLIIPLLHHLFFYVIFTTLQSCFTSFTEDSACLIWSYSVLLLEYHNISPQAPWLSWAATAGAKIIIHSVRCVPFLKYFHQNFVAFVSNVPPPSTLGNHCYNLPFPNCAPPPILNNYFLLDSHTFKVLVWLYQRPNVVT